MTLDRIEQAKERLSRARRSGARLTDVSAETGVARGSLYNLLNGTHATEDLTLDRLEPWLDRWERGRNGGTEIVSDPEAPEAGWAGQKGADPIMDVLGRTPDAVRRQHGFVSLEAAAEIGYKLALRIALPPDEMEKIMAWRRTLLDAAESG